MADDKSLVVVVPNEEVSKALAGLLSGEGLEQIDTSEIQASIVQRILMSETESEAFQEVDTWSSQDMIDVPMEVYDMRVFRSRFNDGRGGFVAADVCRLDTGERGVLTTSAAKVAARIVWLKLHDALPRKVVVTELDHDTAGGFRPLELRTLTPAEEKALNSTAAA